MTEYLINNSVGVGEGGVFSNKTAAKLLADKLSNDDKIPRSILKRKNWYSPLEPLDRGKK